ncbi:MAG TPA: fenitrothion hydrolase [Solirubrobacteraceae bacterium]|nr:fenitrothion hydrolase [Solirubrobacteraceae bacterium]
MALAAALAAPEAALAHGLSARQDLPIPEWLLAWGAAAVLVASFVALAALWPRPRLERARARDVARFPLVLEVALGALGVAAFALTVWAGLAGSQTPAANLAPTVVYVGFWVGLPVLSVLLGDVFAALSPWRAVARAAGWAAARLGAAAPAPLAYPARLGRWPAAAGILAFAWLELCHTDRDDPSLLAVLALGYAAVQLVGMALYGVERWTREADAFGVYFGLFARLSPLRWEGRRLSVRAPLSGATWLDAVPGTVALLCVMIGSTSFDGLSQGGAWTGERGPAVRLQDAFEGLGLGPEPALEAAYTVGLLAMVALVAAVFAVGVRGMTTVGRDHRAGELARRFAHTLIPIALAYVVAHYFSLLVFQGQAMAFLVSDPLGDGSDYLGTATASIDYGLLGANAVWYVQVAALVVGHVAGLTLAHDRALVVYDRAREAARSQYWMLAVMVAFTGLGLYLLSATS